MEFRWDNTTDFVDMQGEKTELYGEVRVDFILNFAEFLKNEFDVPENTIKSIAWSVYCRMGAFCLRYHTPAHILSIFQFHEKLLNEGAGSDYELDSTEQLAIWFHDSVYVPLAGEAENEYNSALFMNAMMQPFVEDKNILARAAEIIGATAYHLSTETVDPRIDFILDLDLCSFAFDYPNFEKASNLVTLEYQAKYTPDEIKSGRKHFLETMLERGFVYRSPIMLEKYEEKAKENLKKMIESL